MAEEIQNCGWVFKIQCPLQWEQLAETADPAVRTCGVCLQNVYRCESDEQVTAHAKLGRCVALYKPDPLPSDDDCCLLGEVEIVDWESRSAVRPFAYRSEGLDFLRYLSDVQRFLQQKQGCYLMVLPKKRIAASPIAARGVSKGLKTQVAPSLTRRAAKARAFHPLDIGVMPSKIQSVYHAQNLTPPSARVSLAERLRRG